MRYGTLLTSQQRQLGLVEHICPLSLKSEQRPSLETRSLKAFREGGI